jgi:hypothetical protein
MRKGMILYLVLVRFFLGGGGNVARSVCCLAAQSDGNSASATAWYAMWCSYVWGVMCDASACTTAAGVEHGRNIKDGTLPNHHPHICVGTPNHRAHVTCAVAIV